MNPGADKAYIRAWSFFRPYFALARGHVRREPLVYLRSQALYYYVFFLLRCISMRIRN